MKYSAAALGAFASWSYAQTSGTDEEEPCAAISQAWADSTSLEFTVPAQLAYDCMRSVPINEERAAELVYSLIAYTEFQSTLAYLADPPEDYEYPAIDVIQELTDIAKDIENGEYERELDYATDVFRVFQRTQDGHYSFHPDVMFSAFDFRRPAILTSVSMDGSELPQVYGVEDLRSEADFTPSPVISIDGKDTVEFVEDQLVGYCHDPDTCYNTMFYHLNYYWGGTGGLGVFGDPSEFPGANTTLEFENGTTTTLENYAVVLDWSSFIQSGEDYYDEFCTFTNIEDQYFETPLSEELPQPINVELYPTPEEFSFDETVAGFFLDDEGDEDFSDFAVLYLPTFISDPLDHQMTIENFFEQCKSEGKTKLVVDIQGNSGGIRYEAFDTFAQIFPDIEPVLAERIRAHESLNVLGEPLNRILEDSDDIAVTDFLLADEEDILLGNAYVSPFNYRHRRTLDNETFESWDDFFGPVETYGDTFTTQYTRFFDEEEELLLGFPHPTGFGDRQRGFERVFDEVIMLTDGRCASACSILSNLLRERADVISVTLGGRPQTGPMKFVGSTRGTHAFGPGFINPIVEYVRSEVSSSERDNFDEGITANLTEVPILRNAGVVSIMNLNIADNIRLGDETETPLQFIFQAADCRLFYTPEMMFDATVAWRAAARVLNGDFSACVEDSTNHPSSVTGNDGEGALIELDAGSESEGDAAGSDTDDSDDSDDSDVRSDLDSDEADDASHLRAAATWLAVSLIIAFMI